MQCEVAKCGVPKQSAECGVRSAEFEVRSAECPARRCRARRSGVSGLPDGLKVPPIRDGMAKSCHGNPGSWQLSMQVAPGVRRQFLIARRPPCDRRFCADARDAACFARPATLLRVSVRYGHTEFAGFVDHRLRGSQLETQNKPPCIARHAASVHDKAE